MFLSRTKGIRVQVIFFSPNQLQNDVIVVGCFFFITNFISIEQFASFIHGIDDYR